MFSIVHVIIIVVVVTAATNIVIITVTVVIVIIFIIIIITVGRMFKPDTFSLLLYVRNGGTKIPNTI
jgi:hypothetical protein